MMTRIYCFFLITLSCLLFEQSSFAGCAITAYPLQGGTGGDGGQIYIRYWKANSFSGSFVTTSGSKGDIGGSASCSAYTLWECGYETDWGMGYDISGTSFLCSASSSSSNGYTANPMSSKSGDYEILPAGF